MKTPSAIVLTAVVLVAGSTLAVMNNACKSGRHGWCAPMSALRQDIKLEPPEQYNHSSALCRWLKCAHFVRHRALLPGASLAHG